MSDIKPKTAEGYDPDVTAACERALVTLLSAFGTLKSTVRLIGGLVPRYLTPERPPEVPAHAGTSDLDVVLNIEVLADGEGYASLASQLKARGFSRHTNVDGVATAWRWKRQVDEHLYVVVDFLRDKKDGDPAKAVAIDGERVSAMPISYAGIVHDWYLEREIGAELLDGAGFSNEKIRFADVPAFIILKALAFDDRGENKDAADLIHVLRYAGTPEEVAELFVERHASGLHSEAFAAGIRALRVRFCTDHMAPGYKKTGPVAYATFWGIEDQDEKVLKQRDASGLVTMVLALIEERLAMAQGA